MTGAHVPVCPERSTTRAFSEVRLRSAIVTGGAGGIGSAICRRLAAQGYLLAVADRDKSHVDTVVASLPSVDGNEHQGFVGDLTMSGPNRDLALAAASIAPIGLVVNAVGISPKRDGRKIPFHELDDELWNRVLAVNLNAPFYAVRESYDKMPTDGTASIINLLSVTSRMGAGSELDQFPPYLPTTAVYAASKGALQNLTATLCRELASRSIRVNGVAPGFVGTPMMNNTNDDSVLVGQLPTKRYATPEEVADAVAFLASERAAYINGACIDINGGWLPA